MACCPKSKSRQLVCAILGECHCCMGLWMLAPPEQGHAWSSMTGLLSQLSAVIQILSVSDEQSGQTFSCKC